MDRINRLIQDFAMAHTAAKQNPKLLLENHSAHASACAERCRVSSQALQSLVSLEDSLDHPLPLRQFLFACRDKQKACVSCMLSSKRKLDHPECEQRINNYFETLDALVAYGLGISNG